MAQVFVPTEGEGSGSTSSNSTTNQLNFKLGPSSNYDALSSIETGTLYFAENDSNNETYLYLNGKNIVPKEKNHASTTTTYGKGTSSNYGHVKLSDSYTDSTATASGGIAATPKAVYDVYNFANDALDTAQDAWNYAEVLDETIEEVRDIANSKLFGSYGTLEPGRAVSNPSDG